MNGYIRGSTSGRLDELEQRRVDLRSEIAATEAGPELPRLHGNLVEVYRTKVERLREAFLADGGTETLEAARALIDRVEVHPLLSLAASRGLSCWVS